jgi:hypothetical protein
VIAALGINVVFDDDAETTNEPAAVSASVTVYDIALEVAPEHKPVTFAGDVMVGGVFGLLENNVGVALKFSKACPPPAAVFQLNVVAPGLLPLVTPVTTTTILVPAGVTVGEKEI